MAARRKNTRFVHVIVPKLLPDTKVEVRSLEEGLLGSWHPATVVSGGDSTRNVKYDHLLSDEGDDYITECVKVSSYIDGEDDIKGLPQNYRGIIRPFPPSLDSGKLSLHYGQCVDMYFNDAWWEGVIFDHEDDSEERKIFFPDMGDETIARVETLRITRDWDEKLDHWNSRGNWLFLELIEEIEQHWPLLVSVKQIWYETRLMGFRDFKEWTNVHSDTWRKWVSRVWYDNLKIVINQIFNELNSSGLLPEDQQLFELSEPALDAILKSGSFSGNSFAAAAFGFPVLEEEEPLLPSTLEPKPSSPNHCSEILRNENGKETLSRITHQKIEWIPVPPDMLPEPGLYPDAVYSYGDGQVKNNKAIQKIKGHLLSLNYKIYFNKDIKHRLRYVSPEGVNFHSLRELCRLLKEKSQFNSPLHEDKEKSLVILEEDAQCSPCSSDGLTPSLKRKTKRQKKKPEVHVESSSGMLMLEYPAGPSKADYCAIEKRKKRNSSVADISPRQTKRQKFIPQLLDDELGDGPADCSTRVLRSTKRAVEEVIPSSHQSPRTVLSWLIDNNVVLAGEKVYYREKDSESILLEGKITRDGIRCFCCHCTFSISKFESHFCGSEANIFLEGGRSLLNCQLQFECEKRSRSSRMRSRDVKLNDKIPMNDYICSVCHDGGDLVLCDQCPSSYHKECVGLEVLPEGDWFCPSCCCGVCGNKFDKNLKSITDDGGLSCSQCERQYHFRCVQDDVCKQNKRCLDGIWFCNKKCEMIFQGLHRLLGKAIPVGDDNLTWTLVKYEEAGDGDCDDHHDGSSITTYSKLSVALSVMHECFLPIKERLTQRDLIEDTIFCRWSELRRLSFQGFYTVLLEKNDELITTAIVRVYGEKLAEVPFVATRFHYRRKGMCRILMDELEKKLMELGVERLVLPAVETSLETWTSSFSFSKMTMSDRLKFLSYTFLSFHGAIMCQKFLKENISSTSCLTKGSEKKTHSDNTEATQRYIDGNSADSDFYQADHVKNDDCRSIVHAVEASDYI